MLLDWSQIQDEKTFQRLINDLFAIEIGKPGHFNASSPLIGADGGWDGMFDISYNEQSGLSSVQSKYTNQNHTQAKAFLKKGLSGDTKTKKIGELEKSKNKKVKNLYYCTNAELKVDDIIELSALNKGHVDSLFIYYREKLRPLIEKSPWIRHKYFKQPLAPLFVPVTEYQRSEENLLLQFPLLERETLVTDVLNFLSDNGQKIFELIAPQGSGKSLFLAKITEIIQEKTNWTVFFFRPVMPLSQDCIQEISDNNKKYLIIVDNADIEPDSFEGLIKGINNMTENNKKILFSARTPTKDKVETIVSQRRITPIVRTLPTLTKDSLMKLFEQSAVGVTLPHPERVLKEMAYNPQAIVDYGRLLSKKIKTPEFKQSILNIVNEYIESEKYISFISKDNLKNLVLHLALLVPVKDNDLEEIRKQFNTKYGITNEQFDSAISILIDAKILRKINSAIRFSPDLCGILVISKTIEENAFFLDNVIDKYLDLNPEKVMENVYLATGHINVEYISKAISDKINDLVNNDSNISSDDITNILKWLVPASRLMPEQSLNLLSVLLKLNDSDYINSDHYGPVFIALFETIGYSTQIIDLLIIFAKNIKKGTYDTYSIGSLSSKLVSPLDRNFNEVINRLQILADLIPSISTTEIKGGLNVFIESIKEALLGSHQYSENYEYTLTIGRKSLVYSPKLIEYRSAAMLGLEQLIKHHDQKVRSESINIIEQIGSESNGPQGDLWLKIVSEKSTALDWLSEIILDSNLMTLSEIENTCVHIWANNDTYPELEEKCIEVIRKIPKTPEYNLFKILSNNRTLILDFDKTISDAPKKERWSWLVHNCFRGLSTNEKDFLPETIKDIAAKYKTRDEILNLLTLLDNQIKKDYWGYIPVIETWYSIDKDSLNEIMENEVDVIIPARFRLGFHIAFQKNNDDYLPLYINGLTQNEIIPYEQVIYVLQMIKVSTVSLDQKITWYLILINHFDNRDARIFISDYWRLFEGVFEQEMQEKIIKPLTLIIEKNLLQDEMSDLDHCLHFLTKNNILSGDALEKLKKLIYEKLITIKNIDNHEELLKLACGSSLEQIIEFIEKRSIFSKKNNIYLNAFPYHGLDSLNEVIKSYKDFKYFYQKIYSLVSRDLLTRFDMERIVKKMTNKSDSEGSFHDKYVLELLASGDKDATLELIFLLSTLEFSGDQIDLYISIFNLAEKHLLSDKAYDAFAGIVFSYSWTGTIGEPPIALINRRDILITMKDRLPAGKLKSVIDAYATRFDEDIKKHEEEAEF